MGCDNRKAAKSFLSECEQLRESTACDFVGVALQKYDELDVIWPFVHGNSNEKYKYITVRYGKGIAGKVIATSGIMTIERFPEDIIGKSTDYPIMLAERMVAAMASPLLWKGIPKGAVLIGYRQNHIFTDNEGEKLLKATRKMETLLPVYFGRD
ncbi:GAF domain-containing protein [Sediminibacillus massiliensis]|uniref:GAF domain-containing protein n=1 Tax=Sediminibacillus massiliensis TaxID=1926277 RepID=UPI001177F04D|nr:GAF domain-containing protein [Sediminibacillus massiliensis]